MPFPEANISTAFTDKARFGEWMVANGFARNIPTTFATVEAVHYPVFLKPKRGSTGEGIIMCRDKAALKNAIAKQPNDKFILQEAIPSR